MSLWMLIVAGVVGYIAIGGVTARLTESLGEAQVPAAFFWPVTIAVVVVMAIATLPYAATDAILERLSEPKDDPKAKLPEAKVHR